VSGGLLSLLWVILGSLPSVQLEVEGLQVELRAPATKPGKQAKSTSSGHGTSSGSASSLAKAHKQLKKLHKLICYVPGLSVDVKGITVTQQGSGVGVSAAAVSLGRRAETGQASHASDGPTESQQPQETPSQSAIVVLRVAGIAASYPLPSSSDSPPRSATATLCSSVSVTMTVLLGNR
jgi:hypothetical protein